MRVGSYVASLLCTVFLICTVPLSLCADVIYNSPEAVTVSKPAVNGHSLSFSGLIDLNYYLTIPSQYNDRNTTVMFSWGDHSSETVLVSSDREGSNYLATCRLPYYCMTDTVQMTVRDLYGNTILTESYRVVDNIDSLARQYRTLSDNHDKYLQRLLEAALSYGGVSQKYYKYRTDDLADSDIYMQDVMRDSGNNKYKDVVQKFNDETEWIINDIICDLIGCSIKDIGDDNIGIKYHGASVLFNSDTTLRLYFDVEDETKAKSLTAYCNGEQLLFHTKDNMLYLEINDLSPDSFDYQELVMMINGKIYKYIPLDYLAQCVADDNDMAQMASAMYAFGYFVDQYTDNITTELPDNGIPVIYLNINEAEGTIDDMIHSPDHSVYCYGSLSIDVPEGFHYSDFPDNICESVSDLKMSIRGRGNSTWSKSSKKPFKIKLDKKADLFGLGANKHWVLVANALDATLMEDRITAWLGDRMGFEFTPRGVPVDLVICGDEYGTKYLGSYYLSENVRVDSNRLNIDELTEDDTDPQTITGGYLVQNGEQVRMGSPDKFYTSRGADWATHTPSFDTSENGSFTVNKDQLGSDYLYDDTFGDPELGDGYVNPAQQKYIQDHIQYVEDVMYEGGTAYRDLMDVESAAKYWLVQAFSMNADAYGTGSTYIYKVRDNGDTVGKIYWGPLWDFDYGWTYNHIVSGFVVDNAWIKPLICDRSEGGFIQEVLKQWEIMKPALNEMIADGGVIDKYYEETKASAIADDKLYPHTYNYVDYATEIAKLKQWIRDRIVWFDENIADLGDYVHRVEFIVDDEVYSADYLTRQDRVDPGTPHPSKADYTFVGWQDEDGNIIKDAVYVTKDSRFVAVYVPDSEVTHAEDIILDKDHAIVNYNVHINHYQIEYTVIPDDAIDKYVEWSSSDESYATVDETGLVEYNGVGEVTLTAKLKNGVTKDFVLTVRSESDAVEGEVVNISESTGEES